MRVFADLQVHGPYSRATSKNMNLKELGRFAAMKGLNEVNTTFQFGEKSRRIHHCLLAPSIEAADAVSDRLAKHGNMLSDGRPTLRATAPELVDEVLEADRQCVVFPAHAWTPWFSLFGANSGFDSIIDCYQDRSNRIFALETGMSCYDERTDVLTNHGWKRVHEVEYRDEVCTLNLESETIEFQRPDGIFVSDYNGIMYELKTQRVDLLVTPNHRLVYRPCDFRHQKGLRLGDARALFGKSKRLKKDGTWRGVDSETFLIPGIRVKHGSRHYSGVRIVKEMRIPVIPWLKFFGFWIAEGWVTKSASEYSVYLSNSSLKLLRQMGQILKRLGFNPIERVSHGIFCGSSLNGTLGEMVIGMEGTERACLRQPYPGVCATIYKRSL